MICDTNGFHSNAVHSKTIGSVADTNSRMLSQGFFENGLKNVFEIPPSHSLSFMFPNSQGQQQQSVFYEEHKYRKSRI